MQKKLKRDKVFKRQNGFEDHLLIYASKTFREGKGVGGWEK